MLAQAEGLKFGIEHFRRRKPHCSGTLFWQLNDCWPVLSWSVIDYYGFGKAGYYYARRAYAPVLASFKALEGGGLELWLTNDTLREVADTVTVRLATFAGQVLWQGEREVRVGANESRPVWRWEPGEMPGGPDRYAWVCSRGGLFPANRHYFAMPKDLERTAPPLDVRIEQAGAHELQVRLRAPAYACFVRLFVPDEATRYSDNYFDLEPGEERVITVRNEVRPLAPEMVSVRAR
jgi:beta-mannosidase